MATPMTRDQFENLTALGLPLRKVFFDQLTAVADPANEIMQFYNVQTSTRAVERSQGVGGFGDIPEYTGTLEYDSFELLYRKSYEHTEYARGIAIERKLIDDDEYAVMAQRASQLGLAFDRKMYNDAASVFNNAFATTAGARATGGDGVALCSNSHPYSPSNASVQDNNFALALSYDNLITVEQAMMGFVDSRGNPMNVMPDTLLVPVALRQTALSIVGSPLKPGTANNDANTLGGYRVVVSRYLTDTNAWFLIDSRQARTSLNWFWRVQPEFEADPTSNFNLAAKFRGYTRYSLGFDDWRWVAGSQPS